MLTRHARELALREALEARCAKEIPELGNHSPAYLRHSMCKVTGLEEFREE